MSRERPVLRLPGRRRGREVQGRPYALPLQVDADVRLRGQGALSVLARRVMFVGLAGAIGGLLLRLACASLAPGGLTAWKVLALVGLAGNLPWSAISAANALVGLALRLGSQDPARAVLPAFRREPPPPRVRTALVVPVRDEDLARVLPPLGVLLDGLPAETFSLWILSDTVDPARVAEEDDAMAAFRATREGASRVHLRRRPEPVGFKAGNVMSFLDEDAAGHELFVCLDADSEMSAEAVLRLVGVMEADDRLAVVQQLVVGRPSRAPFARLFQFGMRAGMRTWATGQALWQGPAGPYWGHNAILRVAPFRRHARLELLPDGTHLLSHDQVEAALLHAAGWKVMCLPEEDGSTEGTPPALPEFMARDRRWADGNMQYRGLLFRPGFTWMGRWQLLQAILLFLGSPLWLVVVIAASWGALDRRPAGAVDREALAILVVATVLATAAPKLTGYLEVLLRASIARRYGGRGVFLVGALVELVFSALLAPVSAVNRTLAVGASLVRRTPRWSSQDRSGGAVPFGEAVRLLWPHTLLGVVFVVLAGAWATPFAAGLLLAVPFCLATSSPRVGSALVRLGIARTPEEQAQVGVFRT